MKRMCVWWVAGLAVGPAVLAVGVERNVGPWDLAELSKSPAMKWIDKEGQVRGLYYAGEPFKGHPTRVFAYYGVPAGAKGKTPAMVLVHGGGGKAFREWVELWAGRGYAAIAMDLAGCGPDGKRLPDGGPDQVDSAKFDGIAGGLREAWPYMAVAAVIRAHSLLRSMPEVDADRTGITGISWGGYLTCIAAGIDGRFKAAVPVYGCGFLHEDSAWAPRMARMPAPDRKLWIENYDPSRYLAGCRMPILFVNGTNDFAYYLDSYQKSCRLVRGPRTLCVTVRMPHSHPAGWAPKEIGLFVDSILRDGKPLGRFEEVKRDGRRVSARVQGVVPIREAALHYTLDGGRWPERKWQSVPAELLEGRQVRAELPAERGVVYFLTATDERGAVVSAEHEEVGRGGECSRGRRIEALVERHHAADPDIADDLVIGAPPDAEGKQAQSCPGVHDA